MPPVHLNYMPNVPATYTTSIGDQEITWSVHAPSENEAATFRLPCSAPKTIQLSAAVRHLAGCKDPLLFFKMVFSDNIIKL